ncbi:helix-hairpin-helix domain-containing protein [Clostridium sediminicola]|uniref:helix-hairpin-helix domain-containing protein n=1 Tax=Clostridium sediminicola TaxID=3114879 RepID=UPI0031F2684B
MNEKNKTIGTLVIGIIVCVFLTVGYYITNKNVVSNKNEDIFEEQIVEDTKNDKEIEEILVDNSDVIDQEKNKKLIMVEIKGFVQNPNVYSLEEGSRLYDLIDLAGGFDKNAYTKNLHLAEKIYDEETIVVYSTVEAKEFGDNLVSVFNSSENDIVIDNNYDMEKGQDSKSSNLVNINTADKNALKTLNSIGDVTAEKIINYRKENGTFKRIEDIKKVSGIGDKTFLNFKDEICVN